MTEPTEQEIREYMAATGYGYQVARAMLLKAVLDSDTQGEPREDEE